MDDDGLIAFRFAARGERLALILLLTAFLAVNLFTASRSPVVSLDEVFFADPAINLAMGHGFTSTVWPQPRGAFFAGNVPLYSWLLSFWIRIFGVNPTAVRSLNYVFMAVAAIAIGFGTARTRMIQSPGWRLAAIAAILLCFDVTFSYRGARYDALGICIVSILFGAWSTRRRPAIVCSALIGGALLPWAGLQLVVLAAVMMVALALLFRREAMEYAALLFSGITIGLPLRLVVTASEWPSRDYAPVQQFVSQNLKPGDHAAVDYEAYYPAKLIAADCYLPWYFPAMSAADKAAVNVLIIDPADAADFAPFDDAWRPVASMSNPISRPLFPFLRSPTDKTSYRLIIYRRRG
jgi:hypothetical protein